MRRNHGLVCTSLGLSLVVLLLLGATMASGATVTMTEDWTEGSETSSGAPYDDVLVVGVGEERNRLEVTVRDDEVIVRDAAPLRAGSRQCRAAGPRELRCRRGHGQVSLTVKAGAGADRVVVRGSPSWVYLYGGDGPDVLRTIGAGPVVADGGGGDDRVLGGPEDDWLFGGGGSDRLSAGGGDDTLFDDERDDGPNPAQPGVRSHDVFDGGPGRDQVSYRAHRRPVRVNLRTGRGGGRGERDVLRRIEDAQGGSGDDLLVGDDRDNSLEGLDGDDRVLGRGGDDILDGGGVIADSPDGGGGLVSVTAADFASGGAGDDALASGRVATGGLGEDTCSSAGAHAPPQRVPGCEWWSPEHHGFGSANLATELRLTDGALLLTVNGTLSLQVGLARDPGAVIATGPVSGSPGASVALPLTPEGAALLASEPRPLELLVTKVGGGSAVLVLRP